MTQVADDAELSREALYKALSASGNPELSTLTKVTAALGAEAHCRAGAVNALYQTTSCSKRRGLPLGIIGILRQFSIGSLDILRGQDPVAHLYPGSLTMSALQFNRVQDRVTQFPPRLWIRIWRLGAVECWVKPYRSRHLTWGKPHQRSGKPKWKLIGHGCAPC